MPGLIDKLSNHTLNKGVSSKLTKLSFVDRLFPHLGEKTEILLVCKIDKERVNKRLDRIAIKNEILEEITNLDVTGSPLEHSFGDDSFNASITQIKRNWLITEEIYQPISRLDALDILNNFQDDLDNDTETSCKNPIFSLVSPIDKEESIVLIGMNSIPNWFVTMKASLTGKKNLNNINSDMDNIMLNHLKNDKNRSSKDVDVIVSSTYELFGTSHQMIDFDETTKNEFTGYLMIKAKWNLFTFLPPLLPESVNIIMEIISGSKNSPLYDLWNEIILINKYIKILENYKKKDMSSRYSVMPLNLPNDFTTPYYENSDKIMKKLRGLLSDGIDESEINYIDTENLPITDENNDEDNDIKIMNLVKVLDKRQNLDFTDQIWKIIRCSNNSRTMIDCIHNIFEEIVDKNYKPQINCFDDTRFSKLVADINQEKPNVPQLAGSLSLEIIIDIGIEKISRDIMYLLSSSNLMEAHESRKTLLTLANGEFDIDKYKNKLMSLSQIHMSLEFLNLIQGQFDNCRCDISHTLFEAALKIYHGSQSPLKFDDLNNNNIYTLSIPAPQIFISEVARKSPTSWMCTLTTDKNIEKLISTVYYSKMPIFPPNIYKDDDVFKDEEGEVYYVTNAYTTMATFNLPM